MHSSPSGQKKAYNAQSGNKTPGFIRFFKFYEKSQTFRFSKRTLIRGFSSLYFWLLASFVCSFVCWVVRYIMNVYTAEKKKTNSKIKIPYYSPYAKQIIQNFVKTSASEVTSKKIYITNIPLNTWCKVSIIFIYQ